MSTCTCTEWMGQGHSPGCHERLAAQLAESERKVARLEAELRAKGACWHCKVALLPTKPRCELCPEECDDSACSDEGCRKERQADE